MIRTLYLLRHAEAFDSTSGQKDFDRELSEVGRSNAIHMGSFLFVNYKNPDQIISSPAQRAVDTAHIIAEQLHFDTEKIRVKEELFEASVRILLQTVNEIDEYLGSVMLVGHNPSISYLGEYLSREDIDPLAPCGVVQIQFDLKWNEISERTGDFKNYHYPGNIND